MQAQRAKVVKSGETSKHMPNVVLQSFECRYYAPSRVFGVWFVPALYRFSNPKTLLLYLLFTTKNTHRVMNRHMPGNMEAKKKNAILR